MSLGRSVAGALGELASELLAAQGVCSPGAGAVRPANLSGAHLRSREHATSVARREGQHEQAEEDEAAESAGVGHRPARGVWAGVGIYGWVRVGGKEGKIERGVKGESG